MFEKKAEDSLVQQYFTQPKVQNVYPQLPALPTTISKPFDYNEEFSTSINLNYFSRWLCVTVFERGMCSALQIVARVWILIILIWMCIRLMMLGLIRNSVSFSALLPESGKFC